MLDHVFDKPGSTGYTARSDRVGKVSGKVSGGGGKGAGEGIFEDVGMHHEQFVECVLEPGGAAPEQLHSS